MKSPKSGMNRREFVGATAIGLAAAAATDLLSLRARAAGPSSGIGYFSRFGVDEKLLRDALAAALSRGGDRADLFFQHRVENNLTLEDGEVNRAYTALELGVGVRVVKGDQTGYGYTEELTPESLRRAAETAAAIADGPAGKAPRSLRVDRRLPSRYPMKTRWEDIRPAQKLPLLEKVNAAAFAADKRVDKVTVSLNDEASVILVCDSEGRVVEDVQPMTSLYLSCTAGQNGRREQNSYNIAGRSGFDYYTADRLDHVVREAVARTTILFDAVQAPAGEMPVVLGAGASGILLHEAIGHGMEADFNRKGTSIYADKIGKPIAKPFVNVVDDGTLDNARGTITRPIKDVNIIGNGPKVLERVDMVADDLHIDEGGWTCGKSGQFVPVSQGLPTVRVASITVGGQTSKGGAS